MSSPAVLRWAVHTRGLNRAVAVIEPPPKKSAGRTDEKKPEPVRLNYTRWPDADAHAFVPLEMARCVVVWGDDEGLGTLAEWDQFCRAEWTIRPREPLARDDGGVDVAWIVSAWDVCIFDRVDLAAPTVWIVEHWWASTGVRLDGAEVPARMRAWKDGLVAARGRE